MKPKELVLPLVALVGAGIWHVHQRGEIADATEKITAMRRQIPETGGTPADHATAERRTVARNTPSGKSSISWQRLAELSSERTHGIFARQELLRAEMKIRSMTTAELVAALGEIDDLGLDVRSEGQLMTKIINALGEQDPAAALDFLTNGGFRLGLGGDPLSDILSKWAKGDTPAATAWLDGRIASGALDSKSLDGKSYQRFRLEAVLLSQLIGTDPAAASRRILALPENQRSDLFEALAESRPKKPNESELAAYISLVRQTLPTNAQAIAIIKPVSNIAQQPGYDKIDQYLESVSATPDERTSAVREAAQTKFRFLMDENRLTPETVDSFRQWAAVQSPDTVDQITGSSLAGVASNGANAFDRAADLASHYYEQTGKDEILIGFLVYGFADQNKERARTLAAKISDPKLRQQTLDRLK